MRRLTTYLLASLLGLAVFGALIGPETQTEKTIWFLAGITWPACGFMFYVTLGSLVVRLKRSVIVWVGGSVVFAPIGPFIAYFNMRRLVKKTLSENGGEAE